MFFPTFRILVEGFMWPSTKDRCSLTSVFGTAPESVGWLARITIRMEKMEMNNVMMDDLLVLLFD